MKIYIYIILFLIFTFNLYSAGDSLIAYWSFDDGTAKDFSGNGYDGTIVNHPTVIDGISGKALHFQGRGYQINESQSVTEIGDHILLPPIDLTKFTGFTISMWVREQDMIDIGEAYIFFGHYDRGWLGIQNHYIQYENIFDFYLQFTTDALVFNNMIRYKFNPNFRNQWVHYAMVYKDKILSAYINGSLVGSLQTEVKYSMEHAALLRSWWSFNGEERSSARFTGDIDEVKIFSKALSEDEVKKLANPCNNWITYPNFNNATELNYVGNAVKQANNIRLTPSLVNQTGAVWNAVKIPINQNFTTDFSFKFTGGSNELTDDGSLPGADGIVFVIQNSGINALGISGGGIGYSTIRDAVAIEYDTFFNGGEEINDPNGNHVALQISKDGVILSKHSSDYTLAINDSIIPIENSVEYHSRIDYNYDLKELKVYLDKELPIDTLVLDYKPIDLSAIINNPSNLAYMGFTSATGTAYENHFITSWSLCGESSPTSVYEYKNNNTYEESEINPNPAKEKIEITFPKDIGQIRGIDIYNYIGIKQGEISSNLYQLEDGNKTLKIELPNLETGIYFIIIKTTNNEFSKKFVKL